jgi:hypothetical protein
LRPEHSALELAPAVLEYWSKAAAVIDDNPRVGVKWIIQESSGNPRSNHVIVRLYGEDTLRVRDEYRREGGIDGSINGRMQWVH